MSTVQHQHQPQLQPLQQTAVAVHRQHSQGVLELKIQFPTGLPSAHKLENKSPGPLTN